MISASEYFENGRKGNRQSKMSLKRQVDCKSNLKRVLIFHFLAARYDNGVKSADEIGYSFGRDGHAAFKPVRHDGNGTVAAV